MINKTNKYENSSNGWNKNAYLGKLAQDLLFLSSAQVLLVFAQRNLLIPVETSSTLTYLYQHQNTSLSDIAGALEIPHQLAAQRVAKLMQLNLLLKRPDHQDGRRSVLELSESGILQAELLIQCMEDMAVVYAELYREIECDLPAKLQLAIDALKQNPLSNRFKSTFNSGENK